MRILQHSLLLAVLVLAFSMAMVSQVRVSDAELEGLKGPVKSVVQTGKSVSGYAEWVLKDKTRSETTNIYNKDGELIETSYEGSSSWKGAYTKVDGYKTYKSVVVRQRSDPNRFTVMGSPEKSQPIEPGEKLTAPDKRFDSKFVYEIDNKGRVISERQYRNNGQLFRKRTFKYDDDGALTDKTEEDTVARMTYAYKYDDKKNVIEVFETRDIKGAGSDSKSRTTYTEMKFDSVGNWIERKSTEYSETEGIAAYNIPAEKYTLVDVQYRTIAYH